MKKSILLAVAFLTSVSMYATDLFTGSKYVSWDDGGLQIEAAQFANAEPGQKIVVNFTGATDGIEFKVLDDYHHIPGSREAAWINGDGVYEQFLTAKAVDDIQANGLEIIGANFTITKVELLDGKSDLKEGYTVWTGFFWADNWTTLELYAEGYNSVDFSKVSAIRFYSEAVGTNYVINFLKGWNEGEKFADQTAMTDGNGYKELALTDALRTAIAEAEHWMIQFNKETLAPFNVTDVVLVMKTEEETGIEEVADVTSSARKCFKDGQLVIEKGVRTFNVLGLEL